METIAIKISGGNVQGVYKVDNAPHNNVIIIDDDNLRESENRQTEALEQLEGIKPEGYINYDELHSELSSYINSDDVY